MGSIIGVGIFNLPTSLASYGPITLVSMGLTTLGALALAVLFAALSRRLPADGGPYAYARVAYGNRVGFANAWSYWITAWAGNAAIAVGWVFYVEQFINKGHNRLGSILLVLVGLWLPAAINLSGVKNMGSVQVAHDDPQVRRTRVHVDRRPVLHPTGELHAVERQRRECDRRDRRWYGDRVVQLPRCRDRSGRRRQGPRPGPQHPTGDDLRHAGHRGGLHAVARRGVRHLADHPARYGDCTVLRCGQRDLRWHVGRQRDGGPGDHLRVRSTDRLDDDLRRDAAGGGEGRAVPRQVQADLTDRGARPSASSRPPSSRRSR